MAGIRLHHPTLRAGEGTTLTYVVELPQAYGQPYNCPACGKLHARKALHLRLDGNGDVIVSREIYLSLQQVYLAGLELVNEVPNPPPVSIGAVAKDKERIVESPLNRDNTAAEIITPARTKYEGRDRLEAPWRPVLERLNETLDRQKADELREKRRLYVIEKGR